MLVLDALKYPLSVSLQLPRVHTFILIIKFSFVHRLQSYIIIFLHLLSHHKDGPVKGRKICIQFCMDILKLIPDII